MSLERDLYEIKWFDYRMVSPDMATAMFARSYARAMVSLRLKLGLLEERRAPYYDALRTMDVVNMRGWRNWNTMERLRRWADKNFMPYDLFWEWACRAYVELGFNERKHVVARTGKDGKVKREKKDVIYANAFLNKNLLARVLDLQDDHERYVLYSNLEVFRAENWQDHPIQNDYYDHLVSELKHKHPDPWARIDRLCSERRLSKGYVKKYLSDSSFMGKRVA